MEIFGDIGPNAQYFDVSAYRPVPAGELRFGNAGQGDWRGPSAPNVDMSIFRVFRMGQTKTLQVRAEVFNVTNTPHFGNPSANISNVVFAANGTITNLGGVGGIKLDRSHGAAVRRAGMALRRTVRVLMTNPVIIPA